MCDPKTGQCQECKVGFFGSECTMECDPSCKSCEQKEGKCKECNDGYYRSIDTESTCKKCTNCKENGEICNKTTGECFECIDDSYFGPKCEKQCSITCNDRKCFQNGTCFSCVDDHYGNTCEKKCNENCVDGCFRDSGFCYSCRHTKYGNECNSSCEGCGDVGCNRQGYCNSMKCREGYFGMKCDSKCNCSSKTCSRNSGYCTDCSFGTFGKTNCEQDCHYLCQTQICCMLGSDDDMPFCSLISEEGKYVTVEIKGKKFLLGVDLGSSYAMTLFTTSTIFSDSCKNHNFMLTDFSFNSGETEIGKETINLHSMLINRTIYDGINIYLHNFTCNDTDVVIQNLRVRVAIANTVNCQGGFKSSKTLKNLNGFIGLGIFNQLTEDLLLDKKYSKINFNSYQLDTNLQITFGQIKKTDNRRERLNKYAICPLKTNLTSDEKNMSCNVSGIKFSNTDRDGFNLTSSNAQIYLTLERDSEIKMPMRYLETFKNNYFKENENGIPYYIDKDSKPNATIVKLNQSNYNKFPTIQIILNTNHTFTLNQSFLFKNDHKEFLIEFQDENKTIFILGKDFLKNKEFALNNEEGELLIYCDERGYFTGELVIDYNTTLGINFSIEDWKFALILTRIILGINIIAFVLYVFFRKRKKTILNYSEIN